MTKTRIMQLASSLLVVSGMALSVQAMAASNTVTEIAPAGTLTPGVWEENDVRTGGAMSITDLTGSGGDLETNQPLPNAAVMLTTDFTNAAKAEIGVYNEYGLAGDIIASLQLAYNYHKATNPGQNASASPSLKLAFYNPVCADPDSAGDCYGELIWEAYQQGGGNPDVDTWTPVSIDSTTGTFWWTGGFGFPSGGGGGKQETLAQWLSDFDSDFPGASLIRVSVGVGTYNQGQIGYFDNVSIAHGFGGGFDEVYDFELPAPVETTPIPTLSTWSMVLMTMLLGILGVGVLTRRIRNT